MCSWRDDVEVAGGGDEDVGLVGGVVHGHHAVAFHRRLQRADRIDLGDPDLRRQRAQRLRRALADIAVAADHGDLAGDHHVGGALDAVHQRLAAAVEVVELALGHRVVDVDGRERRACPPCAIWYSRFTPVVVSSVTPRTWPMRVEYQLRIRLEPWRGWRRTAPSPPRCAGLAITPGIALGPHAQMQQQRGIAAVVEDHVGVAAVGPFEDAVRVVPVLAQRLALAGEHRRAARGDGRGGMVLGREDIAGGPAHLGAERLQRLDQHRGLDGHVQRAGDARALQRLGAGVLLADRHQAGHLGLGDGDLLAAPVGERQIGDLEVGEAGGGFQCGVHTRCSEMSEASAV